jgi:hypothetical protein
VGFVVPPLAEAAGVLHTTPSYVFMPDDPALGAFRKTFGGQPGTIEEYPLPGPAARPASPAPTEIVSTGELWKRFLAGEARVDDRALVRARLFDLWIQDWDRHNKQWRWLRRGRTRPSSRCPRTATRRSRASAACCSRRAAHTRSSWTSRTSYENFEGWMTQGGEVDRWLLSASTARVSRRRRRSCGPADDAVVDDAVGRLPREWYALDGPRLAAALKKRRDELVRPRSSSTSASPQGGRARDRSRRLVRVTRERGRPARARDLERAGDAAVVPRRFEPRETSEVRLYLNGATDSVTTRAAGGPITLRVIGGAGADRLDDSKSGGTRFYDTDAGVVVAGPGTRLDRKTWERRPAKPQETPWLEWRDWGRRTLPQYKFWWEPDPALMLAAGLTRQTWGFRKSPYSTLQALQLQYSTGRNAFKFSYDGEFRRENSNLYGVVDVKASGLENLNYFGLGNDTASEPPEGSDDSFYDADSDTYEAFVSTWWTSARTLELYVGPDVKLTDTPQSQTGFIGAEQPHGIGTFGQAGLKGGFDFDTRGHRRMGTLGDQFRADGKPAQSGLRLKGEGFYYPELWDAQGFGGVDGQLAAISRDGARCSRRGSARDACGATTRGSRPPSWEAAGACAATARTASRATPRSTEASRRGSGS